MSLEALGRKLRDDMERHELGSATSARVRWRVLTAYSGSRRALPWRYGLTGLAAALCAAALWLLWPAAQSEALSHFWIEERRGQVDEWVTARELAQTLRFSDGSSFVASPGTTTRVMQLQAEGARLTLERGELDAHVVHRPASRWRVAAGPFVVHVTGTRFRVLWDPQLELLAVRVSEGVVVVSGGGYPQHELAAGSGLELRVGGKVAAAVASHEPALPAAASPEPAPAADSVRDEDELIRPRPAAEPVLDWRVLSTEGRYREALASVEQLGFVAQCQSLPARDLLTLGSTARLAGRAERARAAYLAARQRFPRSSEAAISAFSLGRLASDASQTGAAVEWFQRYLAEQPAGPLAREASGRLIEHYKQLGSAAQARATAERYLKQYPTGPHAALARSVLAQP